MAAEVVWAVRHEMALTVEDVLARSMRALFLNARAAYAMAPTVAGLMAGELGWTADFREEPNVSVRRNREKLCALEVKLCCRCTEKNDET